MASLSFLTNLATDASRIAAYSRSRCLRQRLNRCDCTECLTCCPFGALSIQDNQIHLDASRCTGCMLCTTACPNDAFEIPGLDLEEELSCHSPTTLMVVSCVRQEQLYPLEQVIPCFGGLSLEHLLSLGITRSAATVFNMSDCAGCKNKQAAEIFLSGLAYLTNLADSAIKSRFMVLSKPEQISSVHAENRRSFLSGLKSTLLRAAAAQLATTPFEPEKDITQRRYIPRKRTLVRDLLKQVDGTSRELVSSLCVHNLEVNDQCTLCPLCKGICPTGAIRIEKTEEKKRLVIDHSLCSGCGLCELFCKERAIVLHPPSHGAIPILMMEELLDSGLSCETGVKV